MIKEKIIQLLEELTGYKSIKIDLTQNPEHGDYATNLALVESKRLNTNPLELAKELRDKILADENLKNLVDKVEVAGPGFLNLFLKEEVLIEEINEPVIPAKAGTHTKTVIVEYSSPNIAKRFSIGHFRSTVIGQAIYNLQKEIGNNVLGLNHIGDWGTQFGVILAAIEETKSNVEEMSLDDLEKLYVDFSGKMAEDETYKNKAREWFKKLEDNDEEARSIWKSVRQISLEEFNKLYKNLSVDIDEVRGESFYEQFMPQIISEAKEQGISKLGEKGAIIVELDNMPPAMLVKGDGTTTYFTRDLAAIKYRVENDKAEKIIYEVGSEQVLHFKQVFAAAREFPWGKEVELVHIPHGLIRLPEGKMSTRKGNTIKLDELISEATQRASKLNSSEEVNKAVAVGALKYNDLKRTPKQEVVFNWDEVLNMQGNSGPYIQYTYARTQSILAKSSRAEEEERLSFIPVNAGTYTDNKEERALLLALSQYNDVLVDAAKTYSPNTLCNYLYDLAGKFNTFYNTHKILESENEDFRLWLTQKTGERIKKGLELLGIETPERM